MATKIAVVVGSIRKDSFNRQVAEAMAKLAPAGVEFDWIQIDDLPLYTGSEIYLTWKDGLVVDGEIGAHSKDFLQGYMAGLVEWIKTH